MKTAIKIFKCITMCTLLLLVFGCSKEDDGSGSGDGEIEQTNGITVDELENYSGDLGIRIDLRNLARKGYKPATILIDLDTNHGDYDGELTVDTFTNIAQLNIPIEDLSSDAEDELRNGVPIDINVFDDTNAEIISESYSILSLEENGNDVLIDGNTLAFNDVELEFKLEMPHFLQTVDANGNYGTYAVEKPASAGDTGVELYEDYSSYSPSWSNHQYYFYKIPNETNVFAIWSKHTNRYLTIGNSSRVLRQSGAYSYPTNDPNTIGSDYKFIVKKESNGLYSISGYSDEKPLRRFNNSGNISWHTNNSGEVQYFRILALNTQWDIQQLDTEYMSPILPAVDTSFGFNSTLVNCGNGSLSQEVGIQRDVTTSRTIGWEESLSISSREEFGGSVTVGVEAEANFFGGSVTASAEATATYNFSQEVTASQSQFEEMGSEETNTYFSSRIVTVPSGSASLVYDAYQTYSNVKIPFVKRMRIFVNHIDPQNNNVLVGELSGVEIATQLRINNFNGIITNIESDYVEVTLRGTSILDNMVDTQSEVRDVAANCN